MNWTNDLAMTATGDGGYAGHVGDHWASLQGAHGGLVAALMITAAEDRLGGLDVPDGTTLRAATFGYARGNVLGDLRVDVETVRQGRSMVTSHARASQADRTTTVARLHHSTPWAGARYSDAPSPPVRPAGTVPLSTGGLPSHLSNVETHLHPDTTLFAGNDRAEWIAWSRPLHGCTFDVAWLTMFGDFFPPAVFTRVTEPRRAVTIEYSIQIHDAAGHWTLDDDEYLTARMHAFHSHDGFAVEDGWIWLPDGTLVATTRQTRLAG